MINKGFETKSSSKFFSLNSPPGTSIVGSRKGVLEMWAPLGPIFISFVYSFCENWPKLYVGGPGFWIDATIPAWEILDPPLTDELQFTPTPRYLFEWSKWNEVWLILLITFHIFSYLILAGFGIVNEINLVNTNFEPGEYKMDNI